MSAETRNVLIAYFSRTGHTKVIAEQIEASTDGDLFEIVTINPYPTDYEDCVDVAKVEYETNARPELATHVSNMDDYDVVFLGYPDWFGTMPKAVSSFLDEYDFSGKLIVPFCTSGGSGFGSSMHDIDTLCPGAIVMNGLSVFGADARQSGHIVSQWLERLGLTSGASHAGRSVRRR